MSSDLRRAYVPRRAMPVLMTAAATSHSRNGRTAMRHGSSST